MLFLELSSLEEDMIEQVKERLHSGELKPTFRDLMYISIALGKAWNQSLRARENVEQVSERPVVTQQDYEDTLAAARKRMAELKRLEAVS